MSASEQTKRSGDAGGIDPIPAANFERPIDRCCDVIMKGGVTSGVVYPPAICRIAQDYALRRIGGTSVGAIAAALTAAAEYRRRQPGAGRGDGYHVLSTLASFLSRDGTLRALFAPDPKAASLLGIALNWVGSTSLPKKAFATIVSVLRYYWPVVLANVAGVALVGVCMWKLDGPGSAVSPGGYALPLGLLLVATLPLVVTIRFALQLLGVLDSNHFGWCHGFLASRVAAFAALLDAGRSATGLTARETPPLINWLDALIQQTAGRKPGANPLTFGDLRRAPPPSGIDDNCEPEGIDFRLVTTCVALGQPYQIPFRSNAPDLYFDPNEMRMYFPAWIVNHMICAGVPAVGNPNVYPLPSTDDLPIIVAVRLSMSFPVLFCAVPLWTFDEKGVQRRLWFSDGGLTSNFPIHLFDNPLPRWPSFALDLLGTDSKNVPDHLRMTNFNSCDVFLESDVVGPLNIVDLDDQSPRTRAVNFFVAIIDTMRTWQDTHLGTLLANRSRTIGIRLPENEGGLNLAMSGQQIGDLLDLGAKAGRLIRTDFCAPGSQKWADHRWFRYLTNMGAEGRWLAKLRLSYQSKPIPAVDPTYAQLIGRRWPAPPVNPQVPPTALPPTAASAVAATAYLVAHYGAGAVDPLFDARQPTPKARFHPRPDL